MTGRRLSHDQPMLDRSVFCSATAVEQILDTLSEMAQHIHQGTEVDAILSMVVSQCHAQLQVDRVIIYHLIPQAMAIVQAESVEGEWESMRGDPIANSCMTATWVDSYQQHPWSEISHVSACEPNYQTVLARFQVQAMLMVPILVQGHLWGLLSAHHCRSERTWQRLEGQFLQQIALHLGVRLQAIADRQTAETSRRQYEQIVSATPDCVALLDRHYVYQAINQTYIRWNNKSSDEILGQSVSHLLGETVFQTIQPQIDRALAGETTSWQGWITYAGEGLKFVWATYTPYQELDGTVSGVVINVHDLTELKRVQETLAQSEERFRQMADNIHEVFWMTDLDGTQMLYVSPAYEDVWGQSCTSLYEQPQRFRATVHPEDQAHVLETVEQHRYDGFNHEYRIVQPDGSIRWIWEQAFPVQDAMGQPYRLVGISRDITERKLAEANLRLSEEQRRLALDLTQVGSWDWNLVTGELGWSEQTFAIMGFAPDDLTYLDWRDRVLPEDLETIEAAILQAQEHRTYFNCEYRLHHPDGSVHWILARGQTLCSATAQPVRMVGIVMDISDRKRAELALQQQTQRERALNRVFQAIRQSLDLETIFATATTEIAQLLQVERVSVAQYWSNRQCWRIVSSFHQADLTDPVGLEIPAAENPLSDQLKQGKCVQVEDTDSLTDPINRTVAQTLPGAWLLVPMMNQGLIWGCLVIHAMQRPVSWSEDQVALVQAVADQLVIAIQQANLYQQTQLELIERQRAEAALQQLNQELEQRVQERTQALKQQAEQERLLRFSIQNIHQSLDFEEILTTVLSETRQTLQVDRVTIYQFSPDGSGQFVAESLEEDWSCLVGKGLQPIWADTDWQTNPEERYDQNEVRVVNDIYTAGLDSGQIESLEQFQVRAYVIIPIFVDDQLWGLLAACQHRGVREWQSWEITLLQQISLQLAIALRQSQLYQAAQRQVEALEKLNQLKDDFLSTVSHELRSPLTNIKMAIQMVELRLSQPQSQDERLTQYIQILKASCTQELSLVNDLLDLQRLEAGRRRLEIERIDLNHWLPALIEPFATRTQKHQQQLILELPCNLPIITTDLNSLKRIVTELLHNACKYTPLHERITMAVWVGDERLHIQVSNSGVELPPETLPHVFEKFYRVAGVDCWNQGGTGLGLALVQRLVEQLNGTISVNSETRLIWFTLRLPLTLQDPE